MHIYAYHMHIYICISYAYIYAYLYMHIYRPIIIHIYICISYAYMPYLSIFIYAYHMHIYTYWIICFNMLIRHILAYNILIFEVISRRWPQTIGIPNNYMQLHYTLFCFSHYIFKHAFTSVREFS